MKVPPILRNWPKSRTFLIPQTGYRTQDSRLAFELFHKFYSVHHSEDILNANSSVNNEWVKSESRGVDIYISEWNGRNHSCCFFHSHALRNDARRNTSAAKPKKPWRLKADGVGPELIHKAKWAVYKRQGAERARPGLLQQRRDENQNQSHAIKNKIVSSEGKQFFKQNQNASDRGALLRRVWERQKHLTPAQAADTAYFLALRRDPPEQLLQQLTAFVLDKNPTRSLSTLGLHRLLRVFHLVPGVAERSVLIGLCSVLQRRVDLMKPADVQLILTDLAAIYTPQFMPFFVSAGRALRRSQGQAVGAEVAGDGGKGYEGSVNNGKHNVDGLSRRGEKGNRLTPLQAAYLLHAFGKTDCRNPELFSILLEIVDVAARQLIQSRRQVDVQQVPPEVIPGFRNNCEESSLEIEQLSGEALVMCIKGLANLKHQPSEEQRKRIVQLLTPYLLNEKPSVLGNAPPPRRLFLLFGTVSALSRLGGGPQELRRLIEEACCQPLSALGPFEPCDLLSTAQALQPIVFQSLASPAAAAAAAAAAVARIEAQTLSSAPLGPGQSETGGATMRVVGPSEEFLGNLEGDPWSVVPDSRLDPASPFRSVSHCYAAATGVGLVALRPSLFSVHPAFRVSALVTLASLDAVLNPADRPPRRVVLRDDVTETQKPAVHNSTVTSQRKNGERPGHALESECIRSMQSCTGHSQSEAAATTITTTTTSHTERPEDARRPPLHPILRSALLSVFYRLPCVSLRQLADLLEALQLCDFGRREVEEHLSPHGKTKRWHRPMMAALAREGVRKMHDATPDTVARFLVLFYVELSGYDVSLDPFTLGLHRLGKLPPQQLPYPDALRKLLQDATARPEGEAALQRLTVPGARLADNLLNADVTIHESVGGAGT